MTQSASTKPYSDQGEGAWPSTCDGVEQDAFEEWAKAQGMDMQTHPLHWMFLNEKTYAARQGWKAGLLHAADRCKTASLPPAIDQGAWQGIETAPRDGTEVLAAIKVRHIKGGMWWERHVIAADDETGELHPDYDHGWAFDDYELWMPIPNLPPLSTPETGA